MTPSSSSLLSCLIPVDGQIRNPRLLALFDFKRDEQISMMALVIIDQLTLHLDFVETVGIVKCANRSDVVLQQRVRIPSGRSIRGRLDFQPAGEQVRIEILIARECHSHQTVAVATVDMDR